MQAVMLSALLFLLIASPGMPKLKVALKNKIGMTLVLQLCQHPKLD
jgi:hypothetical protein